ncbi:hypothetical protein INR49_010686 [Caranx melampygus]|nr:hypothetical protein INR49_010686 [Caranx melampygus]
MVKENRMLTPLELHTIKPEEAPPLSPASQKTAGQLGQALRRQHAWVASMGLVLLPRKIGTWQLAMIVININRKCCYPLPHIDTFTQAAQSHRRDGHGSSVFTSHEATDLIKKEPLDYGGFGDVYLCYHVTSARDSKKSLLAEGNIMASLNHERVVKLLGVIMEDRDCSLVMELILEATC